MKKQLSYALLTISLISFNILPAKAVNNAIEVGQSQEEAFNPGQWCVWVPWVGNLCWDL